MKTIEISRIKIAPNRQRREFKPGEINELAESVKTIGLLHAIVLRFDQGEHWLVSGERRLRAIQDIDDLGGVFCYGTLPVPNGQIPFNDLGELSEIEAMEAEFEENVRRVDLTWQEKATATNRLMLLRNMQADHREASPPTIAEITEEIKGGVEVAQQRETKTEIIVSRHLDDPDVKSAPTLRDAFKILQRKEAGKRNLELGELVGRDFSAREHTVLNEDGANYLRRADLGQRFDVILTDPPYGMGADEFGDSGIAHLQGAHQYNDSPENWEYLMAVFSDYSYQIASPQAHAYVFCDIEKFPHLSELMSDAGWQVFRTPLIWFKPGAFRAPWPDKGPQRKYETILYAIKGSKKVNMVAGDVIECNPDENLGHQAQKPVALFVELLKRSSKPGDQVLDPFAGTGTILVAAHQMKCRATAIEIDPQSYGIAVKRLEGLG